MRRVMRGLTAVLIGLACMSAAQAQVPRGVAVTPRNFPNQTAADVDDAFRLAHEVGQHAVFIFQWSAFDPGAARSMAVKAIQNGLTPVLGLSPTTLDQGRKELDLPALVRQQAGANVSFANPVVHDAYVRAASDLAQLQPPFLCLATEINLLAIQRLPEYLQFVAAYKDAYRAVKAVSPQTRVFVSFQWEWVRILDAKEPNKIADHSNVINILRPELDLVGFTTYPSPFYDNPALLPPDYYTWMYAHILPTDPVMLMETGWPTAGSGNELEQVLFIARLPGLLKGINLVGLEWALLHDVQVGAFNADLNTVGLRYGTGNPKPSYDSFRTLSLP